MINLKSNGIIRRVDGLGRIVIPIHMRKELNIFENDNVELILELFYSLDLLFYSVGLFL